jgi:hypothetical protein
LLKKERALTEQKGSKKKSKEKSAAPSSNFADLGSMGSASDPSPSSEVDRHRIKQLEMELRNKDQEIEQKKKMA